MEYLAQVQDYRRDPLNFEIVNQSFEQTKTSSLMQSGYPSSGTILFALLVPILVLSLPVLIRRIRSTIFDEVGYSSYNTLGGTYTHTIRRGKNQAKDVKTDRDLMVNRHTASS